MWTRSFAVLLITLMALCRIAPAQPAPQEGAAAPAAATPPAASLDDEAAQFTKAADTLTAWKTDPRKAKGTVRHLLTLSSGLPAGDRELSGGRSGARLLGEGAAQRAERLGLQDDAPRPDNLNARALALPAATEPGTRFQYGPSHFYACSELLQRKLKSSDQPAKTTLDYLHKRLLEPVGIEVARIGRDRAGNPSR